MRTALRALAGLLLTLPAVASTQATNTYQAPRHNSRNSPLFLVPNEETLRLRAIPPGNWPSIAG